MSVGSVPFPAVTFMEPFKINRTLEYHKDIFYSKFYSVNKQRAFEYLNETNQVESFYTQVFVCVHSNFNYVNPFVGYENAIVDVLRNMSKTNHKFESQKALWNSKIETEFAKRLTSHGFSYSFNVLNDEDILNFQE